MVWVVSLLTNDVITLSQFANTIHKTIQSLTELSKLFNPPDPISALPVLLDY